MQNKNVKLIALSLFCIGLTGLQIQTVKDIDGNVYKTGTKAKEARYRSMAYYGSKVGRNSIFKKMGYSVRCLQD
jgi:hypothetical protein